MNPPKTNNEARAKKDRCKYLAELVEELTAEAANFDKLGYPGIAKQVRVKLGRIQRRMERECNSPSPT